MFKNPFTVRLLIVQICIFISTFSFCQEILFEKPIKLSVGLTDKREAYPVTNQATGLVSLFLIDSYKITGYKFGDTFQLTDSVETKKPFGTLQLVGSTVTNNRVSLLFASSNYYIFEVVSIDFDNHTSVRKKVSLAFKKEKFAGCISHEGIFYLFTAVKSKSSILKMYLFKDGDHCQTEVFDFGNVRFKEGNVSTIYEVLHKNPATLVDNKVPNAIDIASSRNKLYGSNNKLVMTLDNYVTQTAVITIDTQTLKANLQLFDQAEPDCTGSIISSSGSYLYNNNLYQVRVCPTGMVFSVRDLKAGDVIREYKVGREDEIPFKNTPITQRSGSTGFDDNERELSKTKQFLRKVAASDAGVSAYETPSGIEITVGGVKEMPTGAPGGGGMTPGTTIATPYGSVTTPPTFNPAYNSWNSYKFTKSVYVKGLLDAKTFEHKPGHLRQNAFDKIQLFSEQNERDIVSETVFKLHEVTLFGYYMKSKKQYVIRGFLD